MNNFYTVSDEIDLGLNPVENALLEWKIQNVVTFMDIIKYVDISKITFIIEINDINYNFSLNYDYNNDWRMSFDDLLDQEKLIHIKILDLVDNINDTYDSEYGNFVDTADMPRIVTDVQLKAYELIYMANIIEKSVDEFDFDESENSSTSKSSDSSDSESTTNNIDPNEIDDPMNATTQNPNQSNSNESKIDPFADFDNESHYKSNNNLSKYNLSTLGEVITRPSKSHKQMVEDDLEKINDDESMSIIPIIANSNNNMSKHYNEWIKKDMNSMMDTIDEYNNTDDKEFNDTLKKYHQLNHMKH